MENLEELLTEAAEKANSEKMVATRKTSSGMQLLVYPMDDSLLVALGFETERGRQVRAEEVLRKRSRNMARYGAWLPAQLLDGSWYVVRRLDAPHFPQGGLLLSNNDLSFAQELLT